MLPRCAAMTRLERRRRVCANDLAGDAAEVAEAMRQPALEIVRIAWPENSYRVADGDFDAAFGDDSAFLAGVTEHLGAGVRAWRIDFVQHRHRAVTDARAHEKDRHVAASEVGQPFAFVEEFRGPAILAGEEVRERHRQHVE